MSVFGPSTDQIFARDEKIDFAWVWLTLLTENEEFSIYLVSEDEEGAPILVGISTEPDNASLYLLESSADELDIPAGSYLWQVRLEDTRNGQMIVESDPRRIFIAEDPTPVSTDVPPTPTVTATATSTEVPPSPTPTPTESACEPAAPFGWITHYVLQGEAPFYYSQRANVPVQEIFAANCLPRGAILSVGQFLFIPPPLATITPTPRPTNTPDPDSGDSGGGGGGGNGGDRSTSTPGPKPPTPKP